MRSVLSSGCAEALCLRDVSVVLVGLLVGLGVLSHVRVLVRLLPWQGRHPRAVEMVVQVVSPQPDSLAVLHAVHQGERADALESHVHSEFDEKQLFKLNECE